MSQILSFVSLVLKTTESLFSRAAVNFNDKFYIALVAPELFLFSGCKNCILRITDTLRSKCSYKYFVVVENLKQRFLKAFWFSLETRFGSPGISLAFTPISFFFFKFMIFHFQDIHGVKSVQKRSYFWLDYRKIRPEITPYLDIFSAVISANIFLRILR